MSDFGWCFVGAGNIARMVAKDCPGIRIVSVCAGHESSARAFAARYGGAAYPDLSSAVRAPGVEGVYIAAQHPEHEPLAVQAMELGMPVLCEKPMAVNAQAVRRMIGCARENGVYLAEAMWPRHNPVVKQALAWIRAGEIGDVRYMTADFGEVTEAVEDSYLTRPDRAGGALLDMGIYPLAMAQAVYGSAPRVAAVSALLHENGVDQRLTALLAFARGTAAVFASFDTFSNWRCAVHGATGVIEIPAYWRAREATLTRADGGVLRFAREGCVGYGYQMRAVAEQMRAGLLECPEMPLSDTLALAVCMDDIRACAGVHYPWD